MANVGEKGYFVAEGAGIHIKVLEIIEIKNKSMNPKTLAPEKKKKKNTFRSKRTSKIYIV